MRKTFFKLLYSIFSSTNWNFANVLLCRSTKIFLITESHDGKVNKWIPIISESKIFDELPEIIKNESYDDSVDEKNEKIMENDVHRSKSYLPKYERSRRKKKKSRNRYRNDERYFV